MDKLTPEQQQAINKTSTESLRTKLVRTGRDETEVKTMDRPTLIDTWAREGAATAEIALKDRDLDAELKLAQLKREQEMWEIEKARLKAEFEMKVKNDLENVKRAAAELDKIKVETENAKRAEESRIKREAAEIENVKRAEESRIKREAAELEKLKIDIENAKRVEEREGRRLQAEFEMREKELAAATERDRAAIETQRDIAQGQITAEDSRRRSEARQRADRDEDPANKMKVFGTQLETVWLKWRMILWMPSHFLTMLKNCLKPMLSLGTCRLTLSGHICRLEQRQLGHAWTMRLLKTLKPLKSYCCMS